MSKSLCLIVSLALLPAACGCGKSEQKAVAEAPLPVTIVQFNANAADYVGKTVEISGTVDHVCKHGGKRMFIMGDQPTDRVKVESGQIASFDVALEGSSVRVIAVGRVQTMDAAYLDTWEAEARAGADAEPTEQGEAASAEHAEHAQGGAQGGADDHHANELRQIAHLRQQLADSGKDRLSFYHLECVSFEEL